ncbi:MAG: hypothetical protein Q4B00_04935 [Eubacteriales bacterium]|nr:hypothetical protein [Eubacteriales bacterium]
MKTKSILSNHMVMLPVIFIAFAGYFLSIYRGNTNLASNYSLLIIAANCTYFENPIFGGKIPENKAFKLLAHVDGFLLVVWFVFIVVQLFL